VLANVIDLTEIEVTGRFLRGYQSPVPRGARRGVAASAAVIVGMARMYQIALLEESDTMLVTSTLQEAMDWLGLTAWDPPVELDVVINDCSETMVEA
jgi:hypothetical protein